MEPCPSTIVHTFDLLVFQVQCMSEYSSHRLRLTTKLLTQTRQDKIGYSDTWTLVSKWTNECASGRQPLPEHKGYPSSISRGNTDRLRWFTDLIMSHLHVSTAWAINLSTTLTLIQFQCDSLCGPIPAQKSLGNSELGVVFSHTMPKMDFHYSHRFSWEKNTLNWYITCHGYIFFFF